MVPMNFLPRDCTADFLVTGAWSQAAAKEAARFGRVHTAASSEDRNFCYIPSGANYSPDAAYVHFTSNNTIFGTQWASEPVVPAGTALICDASSDIFSRPIDVRRYALIYAGAQKNLGPAGVTLVIARNDLIERAPSDLPVMLQYRTYARNQSMYNTPPTFAIYVVGRVCQWLLERGGLSAAAEENRKKASPLYDYLDRSRLFRATADAGSRSLMNVTFVTGRAELDEQFVKFAQREGLDGLKGHRSVGGMRASIYNAFPAEGVQKLVAVMADFERQHA
jgi:phosphoserine aminotransferase